MFADAGCGLAHERDAPGQVLPEGGPLPLAHPEHLRHGLLEGLLHRRPKILLGRKFFVGLKNTGRPGQVVEA